MTDHERTLVGRHIVRYGTPADQKYLLGDLLPTYDQLAINANMVAHIPGALASFVAQRARNKPYFIDPQTHAFQHDIIHLESSSTASQGEIKKSVRRLIDAYGAPIEDAVSQERRCVLPEDFSRVRLRRDFCKRVMNFQLKALADQAKSSETAKYYGFLEEKGIVEQAGFRPSFVIAPYFYMEGSTIEEWLELNLQFAEDAGSVVAKQNVPLAVQVVISQDVLCNPELRNRIVDTYSRINTDAFLVWVDSFSEQQSSESALQAFVELASGLKEKAPVVNLFGSFFSVLLLHSGILAGVVHGLEYGEDRSVKPVGGGIPVAKYYVPALHTRLSFRTALRAVRSLGGMTSVDDFFDKVCDCQQCKEVIKSNPDTDFIGYGRTKAIGAREYPLPDTKNNSVRHYMLCKSEEFAGGADIQDILEELQSTADNLRKELGTENTEHCRAWAHVLSRVVVS